MQDPNQKDPAVLFYTSDFLTGTAFFTDAERGQYIRLLCEQHQNGHIPENHMVSVCFSLASPVVKKFIKDKDGLYYNVRMEKEIIKRKEFTESRRINGSKGGRPKKEEKPTGNPYEKPLGFATENLVGNGNDNENILDDKEGLREEKKEEKVEEPKTWRNDFETYLSGLNDTYNRLRKDKIFISTQERLHPNVDILLSLEKAYTNFWGKEAGWKHKKKQRSKELDWEATLTNAIDMNKVWKPRQTVLSVQPAPVKNPPSSKILS